MFCRGRVYFPNDMLSQAPFCCAYISFTNDMFLQLLYWLQMAPWLDFS